MHLIGLSLSNMKNLWSETFKCDNIPKKLKSGSGKILLMVLYFYPKINMIPNSWSKRPRKRTQPQEGWGKKIKEKMMDDALMVEAAMSRLLIQEVKSVSLWFPWGSSTWELQLPAARIQRAEDSKCLWHFTTRPWDTEHRGGKIKMCCPLFHPHSTKNLKRGYTAKDEDDGMSGEAWHRERNGKWKQGQDKRLSFPFAERIKYDL